MHRSAIALALVAVAAFAADQAGAATESADPATGPAGSWLDSLLTSTGLDTVFNSGTRGERNNNPGNIRLSGSTWQGQIDGTDAAFVTFDSPTSGIRALAKRLRNYAAQGYNTVRKIIGRYAPSSENNTAAYIAAVSADLGVSPDAVLDLSMNSTLQALVSAIIKHENGRIAYSADTIAAGVALA